MVRWMPPAALHQVAHHKGESLSECRVDFRAAMLVSRRNG